MCMCMDRLPTQNKCCCCLPLLHGIFIIAVICIIGAFAMSTEILFGRMVIKEVNGMPSVQIIKPPTMTYKRAGSLVRALFLGIGSVLLVIGALMKKQILILLFQWAVVIYVLHVIVNHLFDIYHALADSNYLEACLTVTVMFLIVAMYVYFIIIANSYRMLL